ncbi:hypothetical protein J7J90_00745 [Candidatus Micrarchaeota archaeon]|nr:hypothetical protein [Candidatus Micrarchaeota archaeon]
MKTNIRWKLPPKIKYLEAVGAIADKRIILTKNGAQVKSSMGDRTYHVIFDYEKMIISSDDNGSKFKGYIGYPAISLLMLKHILPYDEKIGESLKGIKWKKINKKFKNYFLTENYVKSIAKKKGVAEQQLENFKNLVHNELKKIIKELKKC